MKLIQRAIILFASFLVTSIFQLPTAVGAISNLSLVVAPTSTQTNYGSNPSNIGVTLSFISTEVSSEHVKLSSNIVSIPSGQSVQTKILNIASTNATLEMFDSTAHVLASNVGIVNASFTVSIKSNSDSPLSPGTYSVLIFAGSTSGNQQQLVTFTINPPPTPTVSIIQSKIWMTSGSTAANESNNVTTLSFPANSDPKTQIANLKVELRDSNGLAINNLPLTISVTGPGIVGIGDSPSSNYAMGKAVVGSPGQYSISVFANGLIGNSTITISQNGQIIGTRGVSFTQIAPEPSSITINNVTVDKLALNAGESVQIQFSTTTTSLQTGQISYINIASSEDCESDACSVTGIPKLISGDSSNGRWSGSLQLPTNATTGIYSISIYFPQLKGIQGFYYRHGQSLAVKGVDPAPPAPQPIIAIGAPSLNKTEFKIGETLLIRVPVKSSNLISSNQLIGNLYSQEECESENCSTSGIGKIISGNIEEGTWEISIQIPQNFISGKYSITYGFLKLKGIQGAIAPTLYNSISIFGLAPPPPIQPVSLQISNIASSANTIEAGQSIKVSFELVSKNLDSSQVAQVYLFPASSDITCEETCGLGIANLVSGTYTKGLWLAGIDIPINVPSGNYQLRVAFPKLKGTAGSYADYKTLINIVGVTPQVYFKPFYEFSGIRTTGNEIKPGQTLEGYFVLNSNDKTISTPACIIDGVIGWTKASLLKGSAMSGEWVCKISIPNNTLSGNYKFQVAVVGYANNDKNEQWAQLGDVLISGQNLSSTVTVAECTSLIALHMKNLKLAIGDLTYITSQITDVENFRTFFAGTSLTWKDAHAKLQTILQQNLNRTESALLSIRSSKSNECKSLPETKATFSNMGTELESILRLIKEQSSTLNQWLQKSEMQIPNPGKHFNTQVAVGSIEIQKFYEPVIGKATISFAYQSNSGISKIVCEASVGNCIVNQNGSQISGETYFGSADLSGFLPGTEIRLTLKQISPTGDQIASVQQPFITLKPGLQPKIGNVTSIDGGCRFKILNYDSTFNWFAKSVMKISTDGIATILTSKPTDEYLSTSKNGFQLINGLDTLFKCVPLNQSDPDSSNSQVSPVDDDGVEELPIGDLNIKRESSGKYLMTIVTNIQEEKLSIVASKKGRPSIKFVAKTNEFGSAAIRTSRNLSGYLLKLIFNGDNLATTKVK